MAVTNLPEIAIELRADYMRNCETISANITPVMRMTVDQNVAYVTSDVELRLYLKSLMWTVIMSPFASDAYHATLNELTYCLTTIDDI